MSDVAVLGCGPAGLLAAYGVARAGHTPHIISKKVKSELPGSLHLRAHIPWLTNQYPDKVVGIVRIGSGNGYALKVYGDSDRNTGWEHYDRSYPSWNAQMVYDDLWDQFEDKIDDKSITNHEDLYEISVGHALTISTLPAPLLCHYHEDGLSQVHDTSSKPRGVHEFKSTPYFIEDLPLPEEERGREIIVYNGRLSDPWYRYSILGDKCAVEYTRRPLTTGLKVSQGVKAINNNCDCWPRIVRAGRWAQWKHGILLNHAYSVALEAAKGVS